MEHLEQSDAARIEADARRYEDIMLIRRIKTAARLARKLGL